MADALRLAVIGVGHLGRHHARILSTMEGVTLSAVVDTRLAITTKSGPRPLAPAVVASIAWQFLHHASARPCPAEMLSDGNGAPLALCIRTNSSTASATALSNSRS